MFAITQTVNGFLHVAVVFAILEYFGSHDLAVKFAWIASGLWGCILAWAAFAPRRYLR